MVDEIDVFFQEATRLFVNPWVYMDNFRKTETKKTDYIKCWQVCGATGTLIHCR